MKYTNLILILMTVFSFHFSFAGVENDPKLMQFVCRVLIPGGGGKLDPHRVFTVEQTNVFQSEGKTYDGRSLVPGNQEFKPFEVWLFEAEIPLRIKVYKSASSILKGDEKKGKELFDSLEGSNLAHEKYEVKEQTNMRDNSFVPLWWDNQGKQCGINYYYNTDFSDPLKTKNQVSCKPKNGVAQQDYLQCDPMYLVDAPKVDQEEEFSNLDEEDTLSTN